MARAQLTVHMHFDRLISAVEKAAEQWSDRKKTEFADQWNCLEANGAEMIEVRHIGGRFVAYPSEDFTLHCEAHGVYLA